MKLLEQARAYAAYAAWLQSLYALKQTFSQLGITEPECFRRFEGKGIRAWENLFGDGI